jgi:hypothetical protein
MGRLASLFSAVWHSADPRSASSRCESDRPASFAEIVAASAFLDFGGMPSGDWLHAWEASVNRDHRRDGEERAPRPAASQRASGYKYIGDGVNEEIIAFAPHRPEHAACDFIGHGAFPFRDRSGAPMLLVDALNGPSRMRLGCEPRALDLALCTAAFGLIAGLLVFAHPTLPTNRTANPDTARAVAAVTASTPIGTALSRFGAPR